MSLQAMISNSEKFRHDNQRIEWPTDILQQVLEALAVQCDSDSQRAWHQLAFLVSKNGELAHFARGVPRPILLRIAFDDSRNEVQAEADSSQYVFKIPFMQATVVRVDIDWGDGTEEKLRTKGVGHVEHTYAAPGDYCVRVYPSREHNSVDVFCLDHIGFHSGTTEETETAPWWRPLREIVSLGRCGVRSLSYLFCYSGDLKVDLQGLRTHEICDMSGMFFCSHTFNQPIGSWDVSNTTNMSRMFSSALAFNHYIGDWNVSNVTNMSYMFCTSPAFNSPIDKWDVGKVTTMAFMFYGATSFNQSISNWNVSNVVDMSHMFFNSTSFNQPVGNWNISNVTNLESMFHHAVSFNQPIGNWNVSNVTSMRNMFWGAIAFNQPIGDWNVSKVTNMASMFAEATSFNQPIGAWDVDKSKELRCMFFGASSFDQDLSSWRVDLTMKKLAMFAGATAYLSNH